MSDNHPNTDIDSPEMSVNGNLSDTNRTQITGRVDVPLRDRIAAAITEALKAQGGYYSEREYNGIQFAVIDGTIDLAVLTDAVIAALGADCIYRYACHCCGDFWFDTSQRMQRFALLHGKAHDDV